MDSFLFRQQYNRLHKRGHGRKWFKRKISRLLRRKHLDDNRSIISICFFLLHWNAFILQKMVCFLYPSLSNNSFNYTVNVKKTNSPKSLLFSSCRTFNDFNKKHIRNLKLFSKSQTETVTRTCEYYFQKRTWIENCGTLHFLKYFICLMFFLFTYIEKESVNKFCTL